VVVVILDEFPSTSLLGKDRHIDAVRYPNFAALARGSTWFRNATTVSDTTFAAVPSILDGRLHRWKVGERARPPRRAIWDLLAKHGYSIHASTEAPVCPRRYCGARRSTRQLLIRRRAARFGAFVDSIRPGRHPGLWLKHTLQPHEPWLYLPSGHQYLRGPIPPIAGLNSERGANERWLVRLAYQRHLLQVGAVDRELGMLVARLKATGMYDRTLLVVTADHGISFRLGERDRRTVTPANLQGEAPVPLFVKRPRQRHGRVQPGLRAHGRRSAHDRRPAEAARAVAHQRPLGLLTRGQAAAHGPHDEPLAADAGGEDVHRRVPGALEPGGSTTSSRPSAMAGTARACSASARGAQWWGTPPRRCTPAAGACTPASWPPASCATSGRAPTSGPAWSRAG